MQFEPLGDDTGGVVLRVKFVGHPEGFVIIFSPYKLWAQLFLGSLGVKALVGTLSNLDDEPSGRRPEVFSRSRPLLRMSVMSSTWRSGRDIC